MPRRRFPLTPLRELTALLCKPGRLIIVGSTLRKDRPRDLDIVLLVPDREFARRWLPARQWQREGESGDWSDDRWLWAADTLRLARVLARRLKRTMKRETPIGLDFKIVPASTLTA